MAETDNVIAFAGARAKSARRKKPRHAEDEREVLMRRMADLAWRIREAEQRHAATDDPARLEALDAELEGLDADLAHLHEAIWQRPIASWADVTLHAMVVADLLGSEELLRDRNPHEDDALHGIRRLVLGALHMGGLRNV